MSEITNLIELAIRGGLSMLDMFKLYVEGKLKKDDLVLLLQFYSISRVENMSEKLDKLSNNVSNIDSKLDKIDRKLDIINEKLGGMDRKLENIDRKLDYVIDRLDRIDSRLESIDRKIERLCYEISEDRKTMVIVLRHIDELLELLLRKNMK
ncbi:MAG: hypothetical protein GXO23_01735 [Crenarchaeota archaeon]|nr:hypothetical protein [Thermoproteota archaeon]